LIDGVAPHTHPTRFAYDRAALVAAHPDVILTAEVCPTCLAVYRPVADGVARATATVDGREVIVLAFDPRRLEDALAPIVPVATLLGHAERGQRLLHVRSARLLALSMHVARYLVRNGGERPSVLLARLDESAAADGRSLLVPGLWLPDMIDAAGGRPLLAVAGGEDVRTTPATAQAARPDVLILASRSSPAEQEGVAADLLARPGWEDVPAIAAGRTWLLRFDALLASPGPHLVDGVEVLLRMIFPTALGANGTPPAPERALPLATAARTRAPGGP
jgi:iron complex transport system substrate-binding protein